MANSDRGTTKISAFIPFHLKGADEIAGTFGVSRGTVIGWVKEGAPIYLIGKRYQANYNELWEWIKGKDALPSAMSRPLDRPIDRPYKPQKGK